MARMHFEETDVDASGGSYVPIATVTIDGRGGRCTFEVDNQTGGAALTGFKVELKPHMNADWHDFLVDTDFDSTTLEVLSFCTTDGLDGLAAGSKAMCCINCAGAHGIRFSAKSAGSAVVSVRGTVSRVN